MPAAPHISWFVVITRWGQWKKISERLTALRIRHFIRNASTSNQINRAGHDNPLCLFHDTALEYLWGVILQDFYSLL